MKATLTHLAWLGTLLLVLAVGCSKDEPTGTTTLSAPTNSQFVAATDSTLTVSWSAPTDSAQVTGYRVVWHMSGVQDSSSIDLPSTARSTQISGLKPQQGYTISIYAIRDKELSTPLTVQWNSRMLPQPPTTFSAVASGSTGASLTWTSSDTGITGYRVAWKGLKNGDSGSTDLPANATTTQLTNLTSGQVYMIRIQAMKGGLVSAAKVSYLSLGDNTPAPSSPKDLRVIPQTGSSVIVQWTASSDTGVSGYRVLYGVQGQGTLDSVETATTTATITGLTPGVVYSFSVVTLRMGKSSTAITVQSAPATRYTTEPGSATPLRIYERTSQHGAGLTLDPSKGGPKNVTVITNPSVVQLAIWVDEQQSTLFSIGPAYAFDGFKDVQNFDPNVYISDSTYVATSLDTWQYSGSIAPKILEPDGNISAFTLPIAPGGVLGQGFFVRTGTTGNYHYARVFIKNIGGKLLQGNVPDRYVELEISYQETPNLPFAKPSQGIPSPSGIGARRMR